MFENIIFKLLSSISVLIFDVAKTSIDIMEQLINFSWFQNNIVFFILLSLLIMYLLFKIFIFYSNGNEIEKAELKKKVKYSLKNYWLIYGMLLFMFLFKDSILRFTFQFWNNFIDEMDLVLFVEKTLSFEELSLAGVMLNIMGGALSVLMIFGQILEIIGINLGISIIPIIFFYSIISSKNTVLARYLNRLLKCIITPIIQTVLMYGVVNFFNILLVKEQSFIMNIFALMTILLVQFKITDAIRIILINEDNEVMGIPETLIPIKIIKKEL